MIKRSAVLAITLILLLSVTLVAQAQTISNMGYTLTAPDDQSTCPPTGTVSTTGIEADRHIKVWFFSHDPVTNITTILQSFDRYNSGDFSMAFPYPAISADTGFEVRIDFYDAVGNLIATKLQAWWKVTCVE
ncbi:hypothetical protein EG834_19475, partial [bacterium]|nr:hypothetical protein [bacterium]